MHTFVYNNEDFIFALNVDVCDMNIAELKPQQARTVARTKPPPLPRRRGRQPVDDSRSALAIRTDASPSPWDRRLIVWCRRSWGWLISLAVHAIVLVVLVLGSVTVRRSNANVLVVAETSRAELVRLEQMPETRIARPTLSSSGAFQNVTGEVLGPDADAIRVASPMAAETFWDSMTNRRGSRGAVDDANGLFDKSARAFLPVAQSSGQAEFFGIQATGRQFVFVVDSSRSMAGKRWNRACRELIAAIGRLEPDQSYCVFFFDVESHLMFQQNWAELKLIPATADNLLRLRRWMISINLGRETFPLLSVKAALAMHPDAVFLLSDGEFHDDTANFLRLANIVPDKGGVRRPEIVVHTIGFQSAAGQDVLQRIANENGGVYRFVP